MSTGGEQTNKQETTLQQIRTPTFKPQWHLVLTRTERFTGPDKFIGKIQAYMVDSGLPIMTSKHEKNSKFAGPLRCNLLRWSVGRDKPATTANVELNASSVSETLYEICLQRLNSQIWIAEQLRICG